MWVISIAAEIGPITPLSNAAITQRWIKKKKKKWKEEEKKGKEKEREREREREKKRREEEKGKREQKDNWSEEKWEK